jgi:hypothetical protein
MSVTVTLPFRIGRDYNDDRGGDGVSRYGRYVREAALGDRHAWDLDDEDERRAEFAGLAWRAATPPAMSPGYVRCHHLITGSRVYRGDEDGSLLASVTVATPPPSDLARLHDWRDWPVEMEGNGRYVPVPPYDTQVGKASPGGYLLTTCQLVFALPSAAAALPVLPASPQAADLAHAAATAVGVLVGALNDAVAPVLDAL